MAAKGIFCALFTLFALASAHADNPPTLPSRKADVVIPLLAKFTSNDNFSYIVKVLGEADNGQAGGPEKRVWEYDYFHLDDKTEVVVKSTNNSVDSITVGTPGQPGKSLYSKK